MWHSIFLVFQRDYFGYVKAWGFWLSLMAVPFFMIIGAAMAVLAAETTPERYYTVVEEGSVYADAIEGEFVRAYERDQERAAELVSNLDIELPQASTQTETSGVIDDRKFHLVASPAQSIEGLRPYLTGEKLVDGPLGAKPLFAAFILSEDGQSLEYWSNDVNVDTLRYYAETGMVRLARTQGLAAEGLSGDFLEAIDDGALSVKAKRLRNDVAASDAASDVTLADKAPTYVAGALSYFLWLMVFSIIQYLLMGTIEERSNKIFDTLLTSIKLPELLSGKLLAVFAVTSTMMISWGLFAVVGGGAISSQLPGASDILTPFLSALADPKLLIIGLLSFVLGYLMYGVMFMALGSLCDTIQEAQTLLSPMMILLMLPMFAILLAFQDPGSPIVDIATWIPLFTPFLLILRMPTDPPLWEVVAQLALMAVTTALIMWGATRVYRAGAVHGAGIGDLLKMFGRTKVST
ncbi:MAG: ABC transporter permease [Hyphomonas sp.]